jgi:hypothetical protein
MASGQLVSQQLSTRSASEMAYPMQHQKPVVDHLTTPQNLPANQQWRRQTSCSTQKKLATPSYRQLDPEDR